jgi:hypothetical protein
VEDIVRDLDVDQIVSLEDRNMAFLDMARQGTDLLQSPEIQKAMREAEKALQELKIDSDPI